MAIHTHTNVNLEAPAQESKAHHRGYSLQSHVVVQRMQGENNRNYRGHGSGTFADFSWFSAAEDYGNKVGKRKHVHNSL